MELPPITNKQRHILFLLYRFRFLTTHHIQHFLNHKNSNRSKTWLKDLTDKGYLQRIYSRTIAEINKPAIYFLGLKGKQELKKNKDCNKHLLDRVYKEHKKGRSFIAKNLFIADLYFTFLKRTLKEKSQLFFYSKTDLNLFKFLLEKLPDAYVAVEKEGKKTKRFLIEVIDNNEPRYAIKIRIQEYIDYYEEGEWERNTKFPFPLILVICPDNKVKKYLIKHVQDIEEDTLFYFLTREEIILQNIEKLWER